MAYRYFKPDIRVLVQGATGREGQRGVAFMKNYHTNVVAGVTPGKGGQEVHGVPVYNTIAEAQKQSGRIDATVVYVPPKVTLAATEEAVAAGIEFINILTEGVPYQDIARIVRLCKQKGATLLGPGSLGMLVVGEGRIGMVGGERPEEVYRKGTVSVLSRSGGMTNEIAHYLCTHGIGVRVVVHLGTELISGSSLVAHIQALDADDETKSIVIFEEVTHASLAELTDFCAKRTSTKPLYLNAAGVSKDTMPAGASFGHVDVLLSQGTDWKVNIEKLRTAGVTVVDSYEKFVNYLT